MFFTFFLLSQKTRHHKIQDIITPWPHVILSKGVLKPYIYTVLCNITLYVIACVHFITMLDHMSDDSLFRCKTPGILWEDNGNLGRNLVQEIIGNNITSELVSMLLMALT